MAFVLKLVTGSATADLNDGTNTILKSSYGYTPKVGALDDETITEQATIGIVVTTVAELDSIRAAINKQLFNAKERQSNHSREKTYVHCQPNGAASLWRSEILDGKIVNMPDIFDVGWTVKHIDFSVIWTRRNYWEGPEAQVPLTNTNGTDDTSGLNIYNCNDGAGASPNDQVNYCEIKAADVDGELPGATRLEMVNPYATGHLGTVWIGQNFTDPANHVWNYEAEDATGGTPTAGGTASDGNYNALSLASNASFQTLLTFTIPAANVDGAKGQGMKVMLRYFGAPYAVIKQCWFRIALVVGTNTLWVSGRTKPDSNYAYLIRDTVTFNLPPWLRGQTGQAEIDLLLQGQQETGGALAFNVDAMYLFPTDGWRHIAVNDRVYQTERLVDDGIEGHVYVDDAAGDDKRSACVGYGNPIYLEPGKLQRLYFLMHSRLADQAAVGRYITVKLYYRPRRYTI